ncbi:MAG: hypothetical protein ACYTGW_04990 [Planctomycetota bacterium]|jgi:hypothetical protein
MTDDATMTAKDTEPRGRWDLWLLGTGVVVLLVFWILDPFFTRPPTVPEVGRGVPVARAHPPDDWFQGQRGELFQERIVATQQYDKGGVTFDLTKEKKRLEAWLQKAGNRHRLRSDPLMIAGYHALDSDQGGRISKHLQWFPHKVEANPDDSTRYDVPYSEKAGGRFQKSHLHDFTVPLFTPAELRNGPSIVKRWLVEYVPINMHERGFTLQDLDLTHCWAGVDQDGRPAFYYRIKPGSSEAYGNFSEEYIGFECALIVGGYVMSVPFFRSRISDRGQISMRTEDDVQGFVEQIRALLPGR